MCVGVFWEYGSPQGHILLRSEAKPALCQARPPPGHPCNSRRPLHLCVPSSQALSLSPRNPKLHTVRAYCYAMIGWFAEAMADYDAVLALEPGNAHAAYNR